MVIFQDFLMNQMGHPIQIEKIQEKMQEGSIKSQATVQRVSTKSNNYNQPMTEFPANPYDILNDDLDTTFVPKDSAAENVVNKDLIEEITNEFVKDDYQTNIP